MFGRNILFLATAVAVAAGGDGQPPVSHPAAPATQPTAGTPGRRSLDELFAALVETDWQTAGQWQPPSQSPSAAFIAKVRENAVIREVDLDGRPPAERAIALNYSPGQKGNQDWYIAQQQATGWTVIGQTSGEPRVLSDVVAGLHALDAAWYDGGFKYSVRRYEFRNTAYAEVSVEADEPTEAATPKTITLLTRNYYVGCDQLVYRGVSRRSGAAVTLKGTTLNAHAADGTPGQFQGYAFATGDVRYVVTADDRLLVTRRGREIVNEPGEWQATPARE